MESQNIRDPYLHLFRLKMYVEFIDYVMLRFCIFITISTLIGPCQAKEHITISTLIGPCQAKEHITISTLIGHVRRKSTLQYLT